ncbi:MAG: right-handed parallel beta-helix repeat-containing protein, partial [Actinomycetota bacterium]|nr:right-handed parallel beta-helix repeat-containing protein [Actinomycetota bacterium]
TVILDQSTPRLEGLQVDGTLLFEDKNLSLTSGWIMVHGKLEIGSEAVPFSNRADIVLTGSDPNQDVMGMGAKVLGVMGGTLEVHGEERPSWTRLSATAEKGSDTLTLQEAPGWRPGDRIVVASTDYDFAQDEEATITAVSGNTVTLDKTLTNTHWGEVQTFDGRPVDERAEVALLSRNVTIRGETASTTDGFGGQIMVMGGGVARIEGAEITSMGQRGILRRYPLHFHMLGDAGAGSYLKDSSIHNTFNRCVTVHGTNRLTLSGNVCHDHLGHGFFFEDGAEVDNVLENNLGLMTRKPSLEDRLLPSDALPSTFWITNPDNVLRNNVAAGSQSRGFWFALPEHPTGLSTNENIWPRRTPLGEFSGNVAHSNGDAGLFVADGPKPDGTTEATQYRPRTNPADEGSAPVVANFEGFVGYKNRMRAVWTQGGPHLLSGATLADNGVGASFLSGFLPGNGGSLADSLVVGETANKGNPKQGQIERGWVGLDGRSLPRPPRPSALIRGYQFYGGRVNVERTTFVNFVPNDQRGASALGHRLNNEVMIYPDNQVSGLRFVDANPFYQPDPAAGKDGDNSAVFVDADGSVTGTLGDRIVVNNPFLLDNNCQYHEQWNAHVCRADYSMLTAETLSGGAADVHPLKLYREDGITQTLMGSRPDITMVSSTILPSQSYSVEFNGGTPSKGRFGLNHGRPGDWVIVEVSYPVVPKVSEYSCDLAKPRSRCGNGEGVATSLADLKTKDLSAYFYDREADRLYLKLVSEDGSNAPLTFEAS